MRGWAALLALLLAATPPAPAEEGGAEAAPVTVRGLLEGRTTWRGTVLVDGDVEVPEGSSLVVEAGTRVVVARKDGSRGGWNPQRVEIRIRGELLVAGTGERPVLIGPEGEPGPAEGLSVSGVEEKPTEAELLARYGWHGIVLLPVEGAQPRREIRGALIFDAWSGIQVPAGRALVEDCVLLSCGVGIEVGTAYADADRYGVRPGVARPEILRTRLAGCRTGVAAMMSGAPRLERCVVAHCLGGAGNHRATGKRYPLREPGTTLSRCDLLFNTVAVTGPSLVTDSIFLRNRRALALSAFHAVHATGVDEYRVRGNVFAANGVILRGESLAGEAAVVERAGYAADDGALDAALRAPWPPLPAALRLAGDSPARGRASGGGDPGCMAERAVRGALLPWTSARPPLGPPLAARLPGEGPVDDRSPGRLKPKSGSSMGDSWWCRVEGDGEGILPLAAILGGADAGGVLAWRVVSRGSGKAELEVNGDLAAWEAWWNGGALEGVHVPRRFGREGVVLEVSLRRGVNLLVARVRGRGAAPRLAVALRPPEGGAGVEEEGPGPAREARVVRGKVETGRDGERWVRLSLSGPVSWAAAGEVSLVDGDGEALPTEWVGVVAEGRQALRVGPLPRGLEGPFGVVVTGLRTPEGGPLLLPGGPFVVE